MAKMRQHIIDGIEQVYKDATFDGDVSMEVIRSRGRSDSLDGRLDEMDNDQQESIAKLMHTDERISEIIANAGDGTLPSEVVDMRTLGGKVFDIAGDALRESAKGTFIPEKSLKVDLLEYTPVKGVASKNMFNKELVVRGFYINNSGVVLAPVDGSSTAISHYIAVLPNTTYTLTNVFSQRGYLFDKNKNPIQPITANTFTTLENGGFIRINVHEYQLDFAQLEKGAVATPVTPFGGSLPANSVDETQILDTSIPETKLNFKPLVYLPSKNMFNKNNIVKGVYANPTTGLLVPPTDDSIVSVSGFIPVKPSTNYVIKDVFFLRGAFYDRSQKTVSGILTNSFTTPANAHFVRINVHDYQLDFAQMELGSIATPYTPYALKLPEEINQIVNDINEVVNEKNYNESKNRLLLPPKMFFIEDEILPLYKSNIFASVKKDLTSTLKTALIDSTKPRFSYFYEDILLNGKELPTSFQIGVKQYNDQTKNYFKEIAKESVSKTSKTGLTPKIINIGDSLTNRNVAQQLRDKLISYGVTPTFYGTMVNANMSGEGREGWEFENFIGMDNTYNTSPIVRQLEKGESTLTLNPFLKLATEADKSTNPKWCFRNTGSNQEVSYNDSIDKTGNFYIFDFAYYVSTQEIAMPDLVTIALSTNDISQDGIDALAQSRLALEIMIKQIKKVAPNCKIGVIPSPSWGSTDTGNQQWETYVATWIENCMTDVLNYQQSLSGIDIVPIWCHLNRDFNFPYSEAKDLSTINQSKIATRTEYIHWGESGKKEYTNALAAYVMNVI